MRSDVAGVHPPSRVVEDESTGGDAENLVTFKVITFWASGIRERAVPVKYQEN